jgi:hypothetical protein
VSQEVKKFDPLVQQIAKAVGPMHAMVVTDTQTKDAAMAALQTVKGYEARIEEVRKDLKAPILDLTREIDGRAREVAAPLLEVKVKLNGILVTYSRKVAAEQEAERKRIEAEKRRNAFAASEAMADAHVIAPDARALADEQTRIGRDFQTKKDDLEDQKKALNAAAVSNVRKNWKFKIVDAAKIRPEYLVPDEVMIGKQVRMMGERAAAFVGGIEVWSEDTVASGAIMPPSRGRSLR